MTTDTMFPNRWKTTIQSQGGILNFKHDTDKMRIAPDRNEQDMWKSQYDGSTRGNTKGKPATISKPIRMILYGWKARTDNHSIHSGLGDAEATPTKVKLKMYAEKVKTAIIGKPIRMILYGWKASADNLSIYSGLGDAAATLTEVKLKMYAEMSESNSAEALSVQHCTAPLLTVQYGESQYSTVLYSKNLKYEYSMSQYKSGQECKKMKVLDTYSSLRRVKVVEGETPYCQDGSTNDHIYLIEDKWGIEHKKMNKSVKIVNGNRVKRSLKIMEWNMGSRHWTNKRDDVQEIMDELDPDIMYITEANIFKQDPEYLINIDRYKMVYPNTWTNANLEYARIVMLIRTDIIHETMTEMMDDDVSAIWIKILRRGKKKIVIGGLYREHKYIRQDDNDTSVDIREQERRWRKMLAKWQVVGTGAETIAIGDFNLDFSRWETPVNNHKNMI